MYEPWSALVVGRKRKGDDGLGKGRGQERSRAGESVRKGTGRPHTRVLAWVLGLGSWAANLLLGAVLCSVELGPGGGNDGCRGLPVLVVGLAAAKEITPHCPPPKCACANQTTPLHSARQQAICWASSWRRSLLASNPPPCRSLSGRQQGPDAAGRCWPPDWYRIGNCSSCALCASVWPPSTGLDQERQTVTTHPSASASPRMVYHR